MAQNCIPKVALGWTPAGKRRKVQPKTTWQETVTAELTEMTVTCGEAQCAEAGPDGGESLKPHVPLGTKKED